MSLLITMCARGGSKGIPGKNIKQLNGRPLILFTVDAARAFGQKYDADIALSTDSDEIKTIVSRQGIATDYVRPASLATESAGKIETIADVLNFEESKRKKKYDFILDLDVTSPLRTFSDLESAFDSLRNDQRAVNIFSVSPAQRNPYFNMVEKQDSGYYGLVKKGAYLTRQSAPQVYELNASFYFYRRSFFEQGLKTPLTERSLVHVMEHVCFDLDHPIDFEIMDFLISNRKLGFEL